MVDRNKAKHQINILTDFPYQFRTLGYFKKGHIIKMETNKQIRLIQFKAKIEKKINMGKYG